MSPRKKGEKSDSDAGRRGVLESSSSYRISTDSQPRLETNELTSEDEPPTSDTDGRIQPPQTIDETSDDGAEEGGPGRTSFPINQTPSDTSQVSELAGESSQVGQSEPKQEPGGDDPTVMMDRGDVPDMAFDDTAAIGGDSSPPDTQDEAVTQVADVDEDIAFAQTNVADPDELQRDIDETNAADSPPTSQGGAAPGEFEEARGSGVSSPSALSGVRQAGEQAGEQEGFSQHRQDSGVTQPDRGSGESQADRSDSGITQPGHSPGSSSVGRQGSGVVQPSREPSASANSAPSHARDSTSQTQQEESSQPASSESTQRERASRASGADANFGATPVGTSNAGAAQQPGASADSQQGASSASPGFGGASVPNPSQTMRTDGGGGRETSPGTPTSEAASTLEKRIRTAFSVVGALLLLSAGGLAVADGALELEIMEKGILLAPIGIGLLVLGTGVLPVPEAAKSIVLGVLALLAAATLGGAVMIEASAVVMLLMVGGMLLTLCAAVFHALVKLVM